MSETGKSYEVLQNDIEKSIEEFNKTKENNPKMPPLPEEFGAVIMHCLTEKKEDYSDERWENSKKLWDERKEPKAEIPVGNKYIRVQDAAIDIIKILIKNGVAALFIQNEQAFFNPKTLVDIVYKIIESVNSLDGCDMCLAYKASERVSTIINPVDKNSIINWFPVIGDDGCSRKCDMTHFDMCDGCLFFGHEEEICRITGEGIDNALASLEKKKIVTPVTVNSNNRYKFKW